MRAGFPVCDWSIVFNAAFAVLAALFHHKRGEQRQFIDIAMLDSIMPLIGWVAANLLIGGQQPVLMGNDNFTATLGLLPHAKDGYVNIAANQQKQWEDLADALGVPELKTDPRFQERDTRKANRRRAYSAARGETDPAIHAALGGRFKRKRDPERRHLRSGKSAATAAKRAPPG